jgi:glycoside/pentoside/hexuronide:cation symporter, GPH family
MSTSNASVVAEKLRPWIKIKYAFASLGGGMTDLPIDLLLLPFYTEILGVPVTIAGWVALAAGIWDALTDPVLGGLSDRTHTRWGRRRPYFLIGAIPLGLSFFWLFNPFMDHFAASFLAAFLMFRLSLTVVLIPHVSLGAEMSPNYDERTSIMGYKQGFWIIGLLLGVFIPIALLESMPDPSAAYGMIGLVMGIFITFSVLVTFFGTREDPSHWRKTEKINYWQGLKILFSNKPYMIIQIGYLLYHTAAAIPNTLLIYFAIHWMKISESAVLLAIPIYMILAIISVPIWVKLAQKTNKKKAFIASLFFSTAAALLTLLIPEGGTGILYLILGIAGIGYGGMMTVPHAILADVVDLDELKTGQRREGLYYGTWEFIRKLCSNLGKWAPMMILGILGFVSGGVTQTPEVVSGIRLMFGIGPAFIYLAAGIVMFAFKLDREEHEKIRKQLEERRKESEMV